MDQQIQWWFPGFAEGLAALPEEQRDTLFRACARHCVGQGVLEIYKGAFETAGGDLDRFFTALGGLEGVETEVLAPGQAYRLCFRQCTCALYTAGYVDTPLLCGCSRQSILYTLETLWPEARFTVEAEETILGGGTACRFRILKIT